MLHGYSVLGGCVSENDPCRFQIDFNYRDLVFDEFIMVLKNLHIRVGINEFW